MSGLWVKFDTSWPRKPMFRKAGPMARLIYVELVMYCKENLTDGVLHDANLNDFATDVPKKRTHLAALVEVGALVRLDEGWAIPPETWGKWNPTKAEVDAKKEDERRRKAEYRNKKMSQDCPDGTQTGHVRHVPDLSATPESEAESEAETTPESETETETIPPPPSTTPAWTPKTLAGAVGDLYAKDQKAQGADVRNVDKLAKWKADEMLSQHGPGLKGFCEVSRKYQAIEGERIPASVAARHLHGSEFALDPYISTINRATQGAA